MTYDEERENDIGTTRWFGASWDAPVCDPRAHIPTPVGIVCEPCLVAIKEGDRGVTVPYWDGTDTSTVAYHLRCWLRLILGDHVDGMVPPSLLS